MKKINTWLAKYFPFLGKPKRQFIAFIHRNLPVKSTYSQFGEDRFFNKLMQEYGCNKAIYLDVGANHPTVISNSYLLYRNGMHGVLVEPNPELSTLCRRTRPKDVVLGIGCSDEPGLFPFYVSKTPVLSSFGEAHKKAETHRTFYIPVLPLDCVMSTFDQEIFLMSIDVEGMNLEVLRGAEQTLKRTKVLCVEYDSEEELVQIKNMLDSEWTEVKRMGCNVIFTRG